MTTLRLSPSSRRHHLIAVTAVGPRIVATAPTFETALSVHRELASSLPGDVRELLVRPADDPRYRRSFVGSFPTEAEKAYVRLAEELIRAAGE